MHIHFSWKILYIVYSYFAYTFVVKDSIYCLWLLCIHTCCQTFYILYVPTLHTHLFSKILCIVYSYFAWHICCQRFYILFIPTLHTHLLWKILYIVYSYILFIPTLHTHLLWKILYIVYSYFAYICCKVSHLFVKDSIYCLFLLCIHICCERFYILFIPTLHTHLLWKILYIVYSYFAYTFVVKDSIYR